MACHVDRQGRQSSLQCNYRETWRMHGSRPFLLPTSKKGLGMKKYMACGCANNGTVLSQHFPEIMTHVRTMYTWLFITEEGLGTRQKQCAYQVLFSPSPSAWVPGYKCI